MDKLDTKVASDLFTLRDDRMLSVQTVHAISIMRVWLPNPRTVFDKGVLKTYFIDTYNE